MSHRFEIFYSNMVGLGSIGTLVLMADTAFVIAGRPDVFCRFLNSTSWSETAFNHRIPNKQNRKQEKLHQHFFQEAFLSIIII